MPTTLRKRYDLPAITNAGESPRCELELDRDADRVTGLLVTADRDDMAYHRGTLRVSVAGVEVITEGHHAKLLMCGLNVAPADRYLPVDAPAGNLKVAVNYTDHPNPVAAFAPYTVSLYIETVLKEGGNG
jgi:hypothetical protein